jgi:hypothetical protein
MAGQLINDKDFNEFDKLHYDVENKLLSLFRALEAKRRTVEWQDRLPKPIR